MGSPGSARAYPAPSVQPRQRGGHSNRFGVRAGAFRPYPGCRPRIRSGGLRAAVATAAVRQRRCGLRDAFRPGGRSPNAGMAPPGQSPSDGLDEHHYPGCNQRTKPPVTRFSVRRFWKGSILQRMALVSVPKSRPSWRGSGRASSRSPSVTVVARWPKAKRSGYATDSTPWLACGSTPAPPGRIRRLPLEARKA